MTTDRLALIALELAAAAIHPYPVGLLEYLQQNTTHVSGSETELEIVLGLPMFFRLYLLGRAMMLHSRLFTDTASRSIGALNKVRLPGLLLLLKIYFYLGVMFDVFGLKCKKHCKELRVKEKLLQNYFFFLSLDSLQYKVCG